jgi:hypothetical protein
LEILHTIQQVYQEKDGFDGNSFPFVNRLAEMYLFAAESPEIAPQHDRSEWLALARDACRMGQPEAAGHLRVAARPSKGGRTLVTVGLVVCGARWYGYDEP